MSVNNTVKSFADCKRGFTSAPNSPDRVKSENRRGSSSLISIMGETRSNPSTPVKRVISSFFPPQFGEECKNTHNRYIQSPVIVGGGDRLSRFFVTETMKRSVSDSSPRTIEENTSKILNRRHSLKLGSGLRGPTIIIDGLKLVMKSTDHWEVASNFLYRSILGPFVPKCQAINFQSQELMYDDGRMLKVNGEIFSKIQKNWIEILKANRVFDKNEKPICMLSEQVVGENLFLFAHSGNYGKLSDEQKSELFKQLGQIAIVDLLIGNMDRLISISNLNNDEYKLDLICGAANLGNTLVEVTDKGVIAHPIDNGVDPELIKNQNGELKSYHEFLAKLSIEKNWEDTIASNIATSISSQLSTNCGDQDWSGYRTNRKDDLLKVKPMLDDLKGDLAKKGLKEGISEIVQALEKSYFELLGSKKKQFDKFIPGFIKQTSERFGAFFQE